MPLAQSIPEPPLLQHYLFENPWPLAVTLVCVAAVLRVVARRHEKPRLGYAALGVLLLGGAVIAAGFLVTTRRERLITLTEAFVHATAPADLDAVFAVLRDDSVLTDPGGRPWAEAGEVRERIERGLEQYPMEGHGFSLIAAESASADIGRVHFSVSTQFTDLPYKHQTVWLAVWRRDRAGDAWYIADLRWIRWNGQEPPIRAVD